MPIFHHHARALLAVVLLAAGDMAFPAEQVGENLPRASVRVDGRTLRLAYAASNDVMTLMEFVPEGQTLENWKHLAAIHAYSDAPRGPRHRAEALAAQIRKTSPKAPVVVQDSGDSRQTAVAFALWTESEPSVEFNVFAFGTDDGGNDVGLQYAIRVASEPAAFLERDFEALRERLVGMILRDGMAIEMERD